MSRLRHIRDTCKLGFFGTAVVGSGVFLGLTEEVGATSVVICLELMEDVGATSVVTILSTSVEIARVVALLLMHDVLREGIPFV